MAIRLDERVAVVTGAGAGLGRAHALLLGSLGARVVVNDPGRSLQGTGTDASLAEAVAAEIRAAGGQAVASTDSVADFSAAGRIVQCALDTFGRIDILVNNAGILRDRSFLKMEMPDFEEVIRVHLLGTAYCTRAAWPAMNTQKWGRVVVTTSPAGTGGGFGQANYAAAKMGVLGLMNSLALEGARSGVLVNAVSPGAITRMTESLTPPPLARLLRPELVSPAVAWLCSERCTQSGLIIAAHGGYLARLHFFETEGVQYDPTQPLTVDMVDEAFARFGALDHNPQPVHPGPLGDFESRMKAMGLL
ncbi:MAG: SDR family NAD(P)-dependent oxidoreductase [Devosia sp.]|nr:SDR family NAD(P)-dependent oxidoreductase [Devosia sp.]